MITQIYGNICNFHVNHAILAVITYDPACKFFYESWLSSDLFLKVGWSPCWFCSYHFYYIFIIVLKSNWRGCIIWGDINLCLIFKAKELSMNYGATRHVLPNFSECVKNLLLLYVAYDILIEQQVILYVLLEYAESHPLWMYFYIFIHY